MTVRKWSIATQPSHSVDRAGWQAKIATTELWIPWRNAHKWLWAAPQDEWKCEKKNNSMRMSTDLGDLGDQIDRKSASHENIWTSCHKVYRVPNDEFQIWIINSEIFTKMVGSVECGGSGFRSRLSQCLVQPVILSPFTHSLTRTLSLTLLSSSSDKKKHTLMNDCRFSTVLSSSRLKTSRNWSFLSSATTVTNPARSSNCK